MNYIKQNNEWITKAQEVFAAQQRRKLIEIEEDKLIKELRELSGNQDSIGGGFKYECIVRKGPVDYKEIPALKGVNLDYYRKENVITWKLSFVGEIYTEGI